MVVNGFQVKKYRLLTYPAPVVELLDVQPVLAVSLFVLPDGQLMALQVLLHVMNLPGVESQRVSITVRPHLDLGPADHAENSVVVGRVAGELSALLVSHPASCVQVTDPARALKELSVIILQPWELSEYISPSPRLC